MFAKSKLDSIQKGLHDVYFGRGESCTVGKVEFDKFGFKFAGNEHDAPRYTDIRVSQDAESVIVQFLDDDEIVLTILIPASTI